jgi:hypothetical protein
VKIVHVIVRLSVKALQQSWVQSQHSPLQRKRGAASEAVLNLNSLFWMNIPVNSIHKNPVMYGKILRLFQHFQTTRINYLLFHNLLMKKTTRTMFHRITFIFFKEKIQ